MRAGSTVGRNGELLDGADVNSAPRKATEGSRPGKRGRPPGSKNKPKGLLPSDLTEKLLPVLKLQLSPDSYEYIDGVLKKGKPIETKRELDVIIAMLARNLMPAMVQETLPPEDGGMGGLVYRKDVTERLKILNSFLTLRHQVEKQQDDGSKPGDQVLFKLVGDRKLLDSGRLGVLVGFQPGGMAGDADGAGRAPDPVRDLPNPLPERPLLGTSGEQVEADRV
jgi:hypothetical protein